MLVLSRNIGEELNIGQDVILKVIDVKGKRVKIGIEADESFLVRRQELGESLHLDNSILMQTNCSN